MRPHKEVNLGFKFCSLLCFDCVDRGTWLPKMYSKTFNDDADDDGVPLWTRLGALIKLCLYKNIIFPSINGSETSQFAVLVNNELNKYIHEESILPHFGATDFIMLFDSNLNKFIPIPEEFKTLDPGAIKWTQYGYRDFKRYRWITTCFLSRQRHLMFRWPIRHVQSHIHAKDWPVVLRDVRRLGYSVMTVIDVGYVRVLEEAFLHMVREWPDNL